MSNFLADAYPSHLVPPSNTVEGAIRRARIAFFVDTYFSKFQSSYIKAVFGKTQEEATEAATAGAAAVVKELEPLLADAGPFFGGSEKLTLAEVGFTTPPHTKLCPAQTPKEVASHYGADIGAPTTPDRFSPALSSSASSPSLTTDSSPTPSSTTSRAKRPTSTIGR